MPKWKKGIHMNRSMQLLILALIIGNSPAFGDQYYVRISIDQIQAGYQRGKSPDRDYLTLYATSTHDPASRTTVGPIDIGTFVTNQKSDPSLNVRTDELLVNG